MLDLDELAWRVLIEGDEQQSLVEIAGFVDPAVVVVAAAEDSLVGGLGRARVGEADVGVERDPLAVGVTRVVGVLELGGPAQRCAGHAVATDHLLLLEHPDAIPELDVHPDRAHNHVGAAGGPGWLAAAGLHPDHTVHLGWVIDVRV